MTPEQQVFCAQEARKGEEPLLGTATEAAVWLLLEYDGPWRARAIDDNDLPAPVQQYLRQQEARDPNTRVLFIKQQKQMRTKSKFFLVRTDDVTPEIHEFDLDAYEDLLSFDLAAIAAGNVAVGGHLRQEPLFLVCTNGKRDKCCAKFGVLFHQALSAYLGDSVWQSTHIGGHRYAPNFLLLPHSINYGFLTPPEVAPAVDAYRAGQLYDLERYRGRTHHAPAVQAADYYLRRQLELHDLSGMPLRSAEALSEDTWRVRFDIPARGETHEITLISRTSEEPQLVSCSPPVMEQVPHHQLIEHRLL